MANNPQYAWLNGAVIPWEDAKVHVRTEAFMRGASIFEGIRAYASKDGQELFIFRTAEHLDRLFNSSMKILRMELRWTAADIEQAIVEVLRANRFREDVHIRPQVYFGSGPGHSVDPQQIEVGCAITAVERPSPPSLSEGIAVRISSFRRIDDQVLPPRVKAGANYLNSRYAAVEARMDGYDDAIFLNSSGKVAEGTGACVMMVRRGHVVTPPVTAGILESITRDTLITVFARELGEEVVEREIDRTELYTADEVFFCGTGLEITPIVSVDRYPVGTGQRGSVCRRIQEAYFRIVRGENPSYRDWIRPVYGHDH